MLPLPISPKDFNEQILGAALLLLPKHMDSKEARCLEIAIALQESGLKHRWQVLNGGDKGAARGIMQFEVGTRKSRGGVFGVYLHPASSELLRLICRDRDCEFEPRAIWEALERDDVLAAAVGRLMLFTDPRPLPKLGDEKFAWNYYDGVWNPGTPRPKTWPANYAIALTEILRWKSV